MNTLKKAYCRIFQAAFRLSLPILPYRDPKIMRHVSDIVEIIKEEGLKRPLIITDRTLKDLPIFRDLISIMEESGKDFAVYTEVAPNPTVRMVEEALKVYNYNECDCLIAYGGGSPIDCAKAVAARVVRPKKTLEQMAGLFKVYRKTPVIIAVPTTSGTGSEATVATVIIDDKTRHKFVINDFYLIPDYAVLDPDIMHELPPFVAATTGMDALTHAVEAYIGQTTTKETRRDAEEAVKMIFENIEDAVAHRSFEAEANMLYAAHQAGRVFTRSYVGYIHSVSHSLSGKYDTPHGLANAVIMPIVLEMYGSAVHKKLAKLARAAGIGGPNDADNVLAVRFIEEIYALNKRLGIPARLSGIDLNDIDELAAHADKEANPLYPVPVLWDAEELKEVYRKAAE